MHVDLRAMQVRQHQEPRQLAPTSNQQAKLVVTCARSKLHGNKFICAASSQLRVAKPANEHNQGRLILIFDAAHRKKRTRTCECARARAHTHTHCHIHTTSIDKAATVSVPSGSSGKLRQRTILMSRSGRRTAAIQLRQRTTMPDWQAASSGLQEAASTRMP